MLVIATYAGYYWIKAGDIGLSRGDAYLIYGRAATFVDCRGLDLPGYERVFVRSSLSGTAWAPTIMSTTARIPGESCSRPARPLTRCCATSDAA